MSELKWIKIVTDIFESPKISLIDSEKDCDKILVVWFKLLCLAGKINNSGVIAIANKPLTKEMIASAIHRNPKIVEKSLSIFIEYNMVDVANGTYSICNWAKHQSADRIEKENERQKVYMQDYRKKQKGITSNLCNPNSNHNSKPNVRGADIDIEEEKEKELDSTLKSVEKVAYAPTPKTPLKTFLRPSLKEVQDYCLERGNNVNAERFLAYYESNGWKVGKNSMKDWKAAVRTWESENGKNSNGSSKETLQQEIDRRSKAVVEMMGGTS